MSVTAQEKDTVMDTVSIDTVIPETARVLPWADVTTGTAYEQIMTSQQLLQEANLDWDVAIRPLYRRMNDSSFIEHPRAKEVYRTDTEVSLGVVRGHYLPWSNREAFSPWDDMVSNGAGVWQEAGSQRNGSRVFMTMKLGDGFSVLDADHYDYYLFIGVGHDGYVAINPSVIPIRQAALTHNAVGNNSIRVQHTPSLESKKTEVYQVESLAIRYQIEFTEKVSTLAEISIKDDHAFSQLEKIMNPKRARRGELVTQIMDIYHTSTAIGEYHGTAYGLFNALTEWQCHVRKHRQGNARFDSLMWGDDAKVRNRLVAEIREKA